jgi:hypothetical protein
MAPFMLTTSAILERIRRLGYEVKVTRRNGTVEMHARPTNPAAPPRTARSSEGVGNEPGYRSACLLARAIGLKVEDA